MPRRIFTTDDLAPLRAAAREILEREPDAALVAAAAEPIKRRIPTAAHEELSEVRLPVDVATSTSPEGVPLHEIAKAVQEEAPNVTGLALTPEGLSLKFDKAPTAAQQRKIAALLGDKARLQGLATGGGIVATALGGPAASDEQLREMLLDPETTDTAWLRAFRTWAAAHLLEPPAKPAAKPRTPRKKET
jgi:hypothetical protein